MNDAPLIVTKDLKKVYAMGPHKLEALAGVNLTFARGEFAGLVGPSGSGKTTLLNILGSLDVPTEGSAVVMGRRIETLSHKEAARLRNRHIGFIFQTFNLLPVYSVYENVEFALLLLGDPPAERRRKVMAALDWVRLADRAKSRPSQLSGGESQRVAIARAVVKRPELVLADEPTANLDSKTGEQIIALMKKINRELETTFIFSTHDARVWAYASSVVRLADGQILDRVTAEEAVRAAPITRAP